MTDVAALWDSTDPAGSERRLRAEAEVTQGDDRRVLLTQVARALGLQQRYDDARAVLADPDLDAGGTEVAVRRVLEQGRIQRSSGDPRGARPLFVQAALAAQAAGQETLHVDALHMVALVGPPAEQVALTEDALAVARTSSSAEARAWEPSLLHNLGMMHAETEQWEQALASFEEALAARERLGDVGDTRVARWMVAWALRHLDRGDEALAWQQALKSELTAAGETDPYVDEEIELLRP